MTNLQVYMEGNQKVVITLCKLHFQKDVLACKGMLNEMSCVWMLMGLTLNSTLKVVLNSPLSCAWIPWKVNTFNDSVEPGTCDLINTCITSNSRQAWFSDSLQKPFSSLLSHRTNSQLTSVQSFQILLILHCLFRHLEAQVP